MEVDGKPFAKKQEEFHELVDDLSDAAEAARRSHVPLLSRDDNFRGERRIHLLDLREGDRRVDHGDRIHQRMLFAENHAGRESLHADVDDRHHVFGSFLHLLQQQKPDHNDFPVDLLLRHIDLHRSSRHFPDGSREDSIQRRRAGDRILPRNHPNRCSSINSARCLRLSPLQLVHESILFASHHQHHRDSRRHQLGVPTSHAQHSQQIFTANPK